jgi:corrinoid protein of di/trimethylamine methyltransferase
VEQEILAGLKKMVLNYEVEKAECAAKDAISKGADPLRCVEALTEGIRQIGEGFEKGDIFLPDLIASSEVVKKALLPIQEEITRRGQKTTSLGTVVVGTVFGDIHSIGKDMVATLLFANGFEVTDLGVNVRSDNFLDAIKETKANILAMSALLTTTVMEQKNVIEGLRREGIRSKLKVMVGGAPINQEFADSIGADGYGSTALEGVTIARNLLGRA